MATILVIEDNPANMELIGSVLEARGYEVEKASDGEKALSLMDNSDFDLILLDMQLPGMDGLEVLERLKSDPLTANIPVVAVTAHAMKEEKEMFLASGCVDYVSKPFDIHYLLTVVSTYLYQDTASAKT